MALYKCCIIIIRKTIYFNSRHRHLHSSVQSLRLFACLATPVRKHLNGCRTNAAAEASCDRARSLAVYIVIYGLLCFEAVLNCA